MIRMFEQQSIELRANAVQVPGMQDLCTVRVVLVNGEIRRCSLQDEQRRGLSGDEAFHFIERLGQLSWEYTPLSSQVEREEQSSYILTRQSAEFTPYTVPMALHKVTQQELVTLPREQRLVIIVVDGHKTVAEIATLLSKRYDIVRDALMNLQEKGFIASPSITHPLTNP